MVKSSPINNKNDSWSVFYIAIFILIVSIIIGHIAKSFKEKFTMTRSPIDKVFSAMDQSAQDKYMEKNYVFDNRIPTFLDHPCSPECCKYSTALTCSHGCKCLGPEDINMLRYH